MARPGWQKCDFFRKIGALRCAMKHEAPDMVIQIGAGRCRESTKKIPIKQIRYLKKKVTVTSAQNPEMGYFDLAHKASGPPRSGRPEGVYTTTTLSCCKNFKFSVQNAKITVI
jgi:hypothetical protein